MSSLRAVIAAAHEACEDNLSLDADAVVFAAVAEHLAQEVTLSAIDVRRIRVAWERVTTILDEGSVDDTEQQQRDDDRRVAAQHGVILRTVADALGAVVKARCALNWCDREQAVGTHVLARPDGVGEVVVALCAPHYRAITADAYDRPEDDPKNVERFRCEAYVASGPGHQSRTRCNRRDEHPLDGNHYVEEVVQEWAGPTAFAEYRG